MSVFSPKKESDRPQPGLLDKVRNSVKDAARSVMGYDDPEQANKAPPSPTKRVRYTPQEPECEAAVASPSRTENPPCGGLITSAARKVATPSNHAAAAQAAAAPSTSTDDSSRRCLDFAEVDAEEITSARAPTASPSEEKKGGILGTLFSPVFSFFGAHKSQENEPVAASTSAHASAPAPVLESSIAAARPRQPPHSGEVEVEDECAEGSNAEAEHAPSPSTSSNTDEDMEDVHTTRPPARPATHTHTQRTPTHAPTQAYGQRAARFGGKPGSLC